MRVQCPSCSKVIPVTPKIAGRKAKCNCGTVLQIPQLTSDMPVGVGVSAPPSIEIVCTSCQRRLSVPGSAAGKKVKCPCGVATPVPNAGSAPPAPMPTNDPFGMPADDPFGMPADDNPFAAPADEFGENPYATSGSGEYGMISGPAYMSAPQPRKKAKRKKTSAPASVGAGPDMGQVLGGIGMMVGAVVWFFGALAFGVFFVYPPILFILGLITMIKGFLS